MNYTIQPTINRESERVERLPVWAKEHIRTLERHTLQCERELKRVLDDQTKSSVSFTSSQLNLGDRKYIPSEAVRFRLGPQQEIEVRIVEDHLHVMLVESISGALSIRPCVTNVVDIYPEG